MEGFEYNTQQSQLILKEYGRNVQKLVEHIKTIDDREKRTKYATILIELMRQIHPGMRDAQDYSNKLWDDLYILSSFDLDVDGPYPMPEKEALGKKPKRVAYNTHNLAYKHYGRNIELLIKKAIAMEDPEDQKSAIVYIGRLMKTFYATWNKENVDDAIIVEQMREISKGRLQIDLDWIKADGLFDSAPKERNDRDRDRDRDRDKSKFSNQKKTGGKKMGDNRKKNK